MGQVKPFPTDCRNVHRVVQLQVVDLGLPDLEIFAAVEGQNRWELHQSRVNNGTTLKILGPIRT